MTIIKRLKVWAFKVYRFIKFGFSKNRYRTANTIFLSPVLKLCDYCKVLRLCIVIEGDYEVYITICEDDLQKALNVLVPIPASHIPFQPPKDHRGIVM